MMLTDRFDRRERPVIVEILLLSSAETRANVMFWNSCFNNSPAEVDRFVAAVAKYMKSGV